MARLAAAAIVSDTFRVFRNLCLRGGGSAIDPRGTGYTTARLHVIFVVEAFEHVSHVRLHQERGN